MKTATGLMAVILFTTIGWPAISAETGGQEQTDQEQASPMMQEMLERMHAMRQQMATIHATEDADERHRLTHEHMESMRDTMMMMDTITQPPLRHGTENDTCTGHS